MREIDELRPMTAGRVLLLWRESGARTKDALERTLLCNAEILAACCFFQGNAVFQNAADVLAALTGRQMEFLLERLAGDDGALPVCNPAFDLERFDALRGG